MSTAGDVRFWDRTSRTYSRAAIADQGGYERTLDRTRALLTQDARVLELGCGTGSTALRLADGASSYLATDISGEMIRIAQEKHAANPAPRLAFRVASAEALAAEGEVFDVVLGFNYLHLVRDLPGTLGRVADLLVPGGLFVSKTPCVGEMNPLVRLIALPVARAIGKAPYVDPFRAEELKRAIGAAGFELLAVENHATKGKETRPFIVARKM